MEVLVNSNFSEPTGIILLCLEVRVGYWRGCPVAVKMFYEFLNSDYHLRLFQQEIAVCVRARHPNIVFLCGVTTENGNPFRIITELLEGSLSDVIRAAHRSEWPLSLREKIDLALGTTAGIAYLHQLGPDGVLHGDIRPSNVVITSLMEAKVCDLGAARLAEMSVSAGPLSPQYLAPERIPDNFPGAAPNTKMADVCSLGVTLVELMTGELPVANHRFEQAAEVGHFAVKKMCRDMICVDPIARPIAAECLTQLERVRESDEYDRCYPKRLVKGRLHGGDQVTLVFPLLPQRRSVKSYIS